MDTVKFLSEFFLAAVPGVLIALLAYQLQVRRENQLDRQASLNGRKLLELEIEGNRSALALFWQEINDLDAEKAEVSSEAHLTAITQGGFLTYPLPHWNFTRWHHAQPSWLAILDEKEVELVDRFYRNLELVTDLHTRMVTLTPKEQEFMQRDNFWAKRYTDLRKDQYPRFVELINRTLTAENPLRRHL